MINKNKKSCFILITGGTGYIGSHMVRLLLENGYKPIVFDNLSTGRRDSIPSNIPFIKGDLCNFRDIQKVFKNYKIFAVMHFAAVSIVSESVSDPLKYYQNNVVGSINLFRAMLQAGVDKIIFSSSACVYGSPKRTPILEKDTLGVENPYGATKIMVEHILKDLGCSGSINFIALRYFNVAGSGFKEKENVKISQPTHLIPNLMDVVSGRKKTLAIFGTNYPTPDGTCIRDYIHVLDICSAHLAGLKALCKKRAVNEVFNLGNGRGFSVKEVVAAAQDVTGKTIKVEFRPRRPGDCPILVASFAKAKKFLGWSPTRKIRDIIHSMRH